MNRSTRQRVPNPGHQGPEERPTLDLQAPDDPEQFEAPGPRFRPDSDLLRQKLTRLREFVAQALAESDPRLAVLGIAEEAVLRMLVRIDDMIEHVLAEPVPDARVYAELRMLTAEMLRCAALAQRFAHLRIAFSELVQTLPEPRRLADRSPLGPD